MARLPKVESSLGFRKIPRGSNAIAQPPSNARAIASSYNALGKGIAAFGGVFDGAAQVNQQQENFNTESAFQDFVFNQDQSLQESQQGLGLEELPAFANQAKTNHFDAAKEFYDTVPDRLKAKYEYKLRQHQNSIHAKAATFARTQERSIYLDKIDNTVTNNYIPRARSGENLDSLRDDARRLVGTNPYILPQDKQSRLNRHLGDIEYNHILGRLDRGEDINSIKDDLAQISVDRSVPVSPGKINKNIKGINLKNANTDNLSIIAKVAEENNYDPVLAAAISHFESDGTFSTKIRPVSKGGRMVRDGKRVLSSAVGLFQHLDASQKQYGYGNTAQSQTEGFIKKSNAETDYVEGKIGRDLAPWERYLIHFQGPGGASKLLRSDPKKSVVSVVGQNVVSSNPWMRGLSVGQFLSKVNGSIETRMEALEKAIYPPALTAPNQDRSAHQVEGTQRVPLQAPQVEQKKPQLENSNKENEKQELDGGTLSGEIPKVKTIDLHVERDESGRVLSIKERSKPSEEKGQGEPVEGTKLLNKKEESGLTKNQESAEVQPTETVPRFRYRYLSQRQRQSLMNMTNKVFQGERFKLKQMLEDDKESIRNTGAGLKDGVDIDKARRVLEPNQINRYLIEREQANYEYSSLNDLDRLSDDQLVSRLNELSPVPGSEGYAHRATVYRKAVSRVDKLRALRRNDPAEAVNNFDLVESARQKLNPEKPETFVNLVASRYLAQEELGIPQGNRQPITKDEAKVILAPLKRVRIDSEEFQETLKKVTEDVNKRYGRYSKEVLMSAIEHDLGSRDRAEVATGIIQDIFDNGRVSNTTQRKAQELNETDRVEKSVSGDAQPELTPELKAAEDFLLEQREKDAEQGKSEYVEESGQPIEYPTPNKKHVEMLSRYPDMIDEFRNKFGPKNTNEVLERLKLHDTYNNKLQGSTQ